MADEVLSKPSGAAEIRAKLEAMVVGDLLGPLEDLPSTHSFS